MRKQIANCVISSSNRYKMCLVNSSNCLSLKMKNYKNSNNSCDIYNLNFAVINV